MQAEEINVSYCQSEYVLCWTGVYLLRLDTNQDLVRKLVIVTSFGYDGYKKAVLAYSRLLRLWS